MILLMIVLLCALGGVGNALAASTNPGVTEQRVHKFVYQTYVDPITDRKSVAVILSADQTNDQGGTSLLITCGTPLTVNFRYGSTEIGPGERNFDYRLDQEPAKPNQWLYRTADIHIVGPSKPEESASFIAALPAHRRLAVRYYGDGPAPTYRTAIFSLSGIGPLLGRLTSDCRKR